MHVIGLIREASIVRIVKEIETGHILGFVTALLENGIQTSTIVQVIV